jgi:hypothetical protein
VPNLLDVTLLNDLAVYHFTVTNLLTDKLNFEFLIRINNQGYFSFGATTDIHHQLFNGTHESFCPASAARWNAVSESVNNTHDHYISAQNVSDNVTDAPDTLNL